MRPFMVFSDREGKVYVHPFLRMVVQEGTRLRLPLKEELIPLPQGCRLFFLPGRRPLGFNPGSSSFEVLSLFEGRGVWAVGAFLIPAYLRLHLPATFWEDRNILLPLWAYTAVGFYGGRFFVSAVRVDRRQRQWPRYYKGISLRKNIEKLLKRYPQNRLLRHFANCAYNYRCLAATNLFLHRWEAPLVVSNRCNASCWGCLSYQKDLFIPSHQRISFRPHIEEVAEVALEHILSASEPIVSFGQGCEGEPLMESKLVVRTLKFVRRRTLRGTIHLNTNASIPAAIDELGAAGLSSLRISLNSAREEFYNLYFRPRGYKFSDVIRSLKVAKKRGVFVSLNLLLFPGFNDTRGEVEALVRLVKKYKVDMVQMRNLSIDSEFFSQVVLKDFKEKPLGMLYLWQKLKAIKGLKLGYFNLPHSEFSHFQNL